MVDSGCSLHGGKMRLEYTFLGGNASQADSLVQRMHFCLCKKSDSHLKLSNYFLRNVSPSAGWCTRSCPPQVKNPGCAVASAVGRSDGCHGTLSCCCWNAGRVHCLQQLLPCPVCVLWRISYLGLVGFTGLAAVACTRRTGINTGLQFLLSCHVIHTVWARRSMIVSQWYKTSRG